MTRSTVYNDNLVTVETWGKVSGKNKQLLEDFVGYCKANNRSDATIAQYFDQLKIFFVWNMKKNDNQFFIDIKKRVFINFFGEGRNVMKWSSGRLASFKAVLSSLSNYIERILDDEYPDFRNLIKVLEPIKVEPVREKTVLTEEAVDNLLSKLLEGKLYQEACWLSLLISSGMRKAEIAQMKVEYFKPENIIFDVLYKTPKIRTKGRGIEGKQVSRYVFIYEFQPFLDLWLKERERLGIDSEYLFAIKKKDGYKPATIVTFNSWAERMSNITGEDIYNHMFRHFWLTKLKRKGYPDNILQSLQQWSSADMIRVYNDIGEEEELGEFFKKNI